MKLYDVISVNRATGDIDLVSKGRTEADSEAIVKMAVRRRGIDRDFFVQVEGGKYKAGDVWPTFKVEAVTAKQLTAYSDQ